MQTQENTIQNRPRTNGVSQELHQSNKARLLAPRNTENHADSLRQFNISNIEISPIISPEFLKEYSVKQLRQIAMCLVNAVAHYDSRVWQWEFNPENQTLLDLILKAVNYLREDLGVDNIQICQEEDKTIVIALLKQCGQNDMVYSFRTKNIFKLKKNNKKLFIILINFIKSLPFKNIFESEESYWIHSILEYMYDIEYGFMEEAQESNKEFISNESLSFLEDYERIYHITPHKNWYEELLKYKPRKHQYKKIKKLLLNSTSINFEAVYQVTNEEGCLSETHLYDSYFVADHPDSSFAQEYLDHMNTIARENQYSTAPHIIALAKIDSFNDFDYKIKHHIESTNNFILEFNKTI
ncbi:hypothetical protein SAMN04489761_3481 [Tenacibaculum sp. MAR_2009_124]|uniref:hypothetical protein n=1 Tax=Tenacibaculum sp. MAR_2009_124 TaxID=1250059 RepID=UPI0008989147|nr:hypothetical protein [Tenacibaculum sp. MAR_2009_124]SEC67938.1 hypothetical protein SAMN04489761_3481 [Tenacibaculum sp. MAR_2009_124]